MKVYVVAEGERGEGGSNVAVFFSEKEAIKFATKYAKTMPFDMVKYPKGNHWHGGCDWLAIYTYEVSDSAEEALEEINN
jgi:hypothetical protein